MVRTHRWPVLLLCLTSWAGLIAPLGAQTAPGSKPSQPGQTETTSPDPLPGLPHPPDQPANLYAPMPVQPYSNVDPMPCKYFEVDPLVDPPGLQPGWISDVQASLTKPVVKDRLFDFVTAGMRPPDLVHTGSSGLGVTVMPRLEVGYRLPMGFGEIALAYRGLSASGNSTTLGPDTVSPLRSRLDFNIIDLDYVSREWALGPCWRMDWRIGVRLIYLYFDSQLVQPFEAAAAGSGILEQHVTNQHNGIGPHCGLALARKLPWAGLEVVGSADLTGVFGRIKQGYYETALDVTGLPTAGSDLRSSSQPMAIANAQLGVSWQPPICPLIRVFGGYEFEYWWEVGRFGPLTSTGDVWDQGLVIRAEINW